MATRPLYLGIDLGTGGVRAVAVSAEGDIAAESSVSLSADDSTHEGDRHEQNPAAWWRLTRDAVRQVVKQLDDAAAIAALCVDGTSGTLVCFDGEGEPVRAALMYNDGRATIEADELNDVAAAAQVELPTPFAASFALAKARWIERHEPAAFKRTRWLAHQADAIAWRLTGEPGVTDYSNALKTGVDLVSETWPAWLHMFGGLRERLPHVVAPGERIGALRRAAAKQLGLPAGVAVIAGCTDGTAGFLASGAARSGDDNTTLGTTLVFKRLTDQPARDPRGLIYSHKLPGNRWLPGAASNTGGEWIREQFGDADLAALDAKAINALPCEHLAYPLARVGERYPFKHGEAKAFIEPTTNDDVTRFAACLQGAAFIERLCYEALDEATTNAHGAIDGWLGSRRSRAPSESATADNESTAGGSASLQPQPPQVATGGGGVFATGGGAGSDVWTQLRADVTGRVYHRPAAPHSAFGAAVLAAAGHTGDDLMATVRRMVRIERTFEPRAEIRSRYDALYERFKEMLWRRGYLKDAP